MHSNGYVVFPGIAFRASDLYPPHRQAVSVQLEHPTIPAPKSGDSSLRWTWFQFQHSPVPSRCTQHLELMRPQCSYSATYVRHPEIVSQYLAISTGMPSILRMWQVFHRLSNCPDVFNLPTANTKSLPVIFNCYTMAIVDFFRKWLPACEFWCHKVMYCPPLVSGHHLWPSMHHFVPLPFSLSTQPQHFAHKCKFKLLLLYYANYYTTQTMQTFCVYSIVKPVSALVASNTQKSMSSRAPIPPHGIWCLSVNYPCF